jgi:hypothetical protein
MKPKAVRIDSFNFAGRNLEMLFKKGNYIIEPVKTLGIFENDVWLKAFGKALARHIIEAKILHTDTGLALPLKRFASSPHRQTLEFAGLYGYTEHSKLLSKLLNELYTDITDNVITRIDIAIDFKNKVPPKIIKALKKTRVSYNYINTCYMKSDKEKKTNSHINICIYPKHIKENLDIKLERLEFSFKGSYFRGAFLVKDLDKAITKMQKTIKRFTGLEVAIQPL